MTGGEAKRARDLSDASLAAKLEQVEVLLDLHSAGLNEKAADLLLARIRQVRRTLEQRAADTAAARQRIALIRRESIK